MKARCVVLTLDLVRQGHVTSQVTFPISGSMPARTMQFVLFLMLFGSGKSMTWRLGCPAWQLQTWVACIVLEIGTVTRKVAWPWSTRSRLKVTHFFLTHSTFLTQNTLETKTITALACIVTEIGKVTRKVTWPWLSRLRVEVTHFFLTLSTFLAKNTLETKKLLL